MSKIFSCAWWNITREKLSQYFATSKLSFVNVHSKHYSIMCCIFFSNSILLKKNFCYTLWLLCMWLINLYGIQNENKSLNLIRKTVSPKEYNIENQFFYRMTMSFFWSQSGPISFYFNKIWLIKIYKHDLFCHFCS